MRTLTVQPPYGELAGFLVRLNVDGRSTAVGLLMLPEPLPVMDATLIEVDLEPLPAQVAPLTVALWMLGSPR